MEKEKSKRLSENPKFLIAATLLMFAAIIGFVQLTKKSHDELVKEAQEKYDKEKAEKIAEEKEHTAEMQKLVDVAVDAFNVYSEDERKEALEELEKNYPELSDKWDEVREKIHR